MYILKLEIPIVKYYTPYYPVPSLFRREAGPLAEDSLGWAEQNECQSKLAYPYQQEQNTFSSGNWCMPYPCGFPETNVSKGRNLVAHNQNGILGKNHTTGSARDAAWRVQTGTCEALEWNVTSILEALLFRLPGALPQNIWIRLWVSHTVFLSWWWRPRLSQPASDDREFSTGNITQGTSDYQGEWVPLILNYCVLCVEPYLKKDLLAHMVLKL